ncbi:MAG: hypothetical protein KJI72_02215 [Patescibacteria group bacterium]|nr:hypothetical protein [Patescibacteria group bacterium]
MRTKKIISALLISVLLVTGTTYPFRAKAFLGIADITINPESVVGWIWDVTKSAAELALKSALEALKKRLLDQLVDETIGWIQGDGDPKFVTDFGGFLEDAGQAAVGDVAREIGLGDLCRGISPVRIQFQLERPVFSQRVSCTLDDIVGNVERFRDSFTSGGWIGYQELLRPQNNRWGIEILAQSEVERREAQKTDALRQEINSGRGFLSTKQCLEWEARGTDDSGKAVSKLYPFNSDSFIRPYPDPSQPPPVLVTGINNIEWVCHQDRVTTPGTAIAEGLERSLYADIDYLVNAQELTAYIGAIFDASINRLIAEGVKGVQNLGPSGNTPQTDCNDPRLSSSAQAACIEYQQQQSDLQNTIEDTQAEQESQVALAEIGATRATIEETLNLNTELSSTTQMLINCQTGRGLTCTQNPTLVEITELSNSLNASSTLLDNAEGVLRAGASRIIARQFASIIQSMQTGIEADKTRVQADLTRIKEELVQCEDVLNVTYACPSQSP